MASRKPRTTIPPDWIRTADVAQRFDVHASTVLRWHRLGQLVGTLDQRGYLHFDPATVAAFDPAAHHKPHGRVGERNGLLTTSETAAMLGRSEYFVRTHATAGDIPHTWTPSGIRLFRPEDVQALKVRWPREEVSDKTARLAEARQRAEQQRKIEKVRAKGWLTSREAAQRLGFTTVRITQLVSEGVLDGTFIGGRWFVDPTNVEQRVKSIEALEGLLTVADVAKRLGIGTRYATQLIATGKLRGTKYGFGRHGGRWFVQPEALETYRSSWRGRR
ncbi:TPA: helix-turn-helix domain-containing protein [Burkholderia vietnamiensis]|nr:helix-turn-helix domain-containing protein [Burkholderia vietnamiensis]